MTTSELRAMYMDALNIIVSHDLETADAAPENVEAYAWQRSQFAEVLAACKSGLDRSIAAEESK